MYSQFLKKEVYPQHLIIHLYIFLIHRAKSLKKTIFKHMYNHLQENSMLSSFQSGFIPVDSTINQLTYLYHTFCDLFIYLF